MPDVTRTPNITISQTPPAGPMPGDLWWSTLTGQQYVFYDDGDTQQWVISNWGAPAPGSAGSIVGIHAGADIEITGLQSEPTIGVIDGSFVRPPALADYAKIFSPTFTGNPKAPTPSPGTSDESIATAGFVADEIASSAGAMGGFNPTTSGVVVSNADYSHFPVTGLAPNNLLGCLYYHGHNHGQADLSAVAQSQTLLAAGNFVINGNEAVGGVATSVPGTKVSINDFLSSDNSGVHFTVTGEFPIGTPVNQTIVGPNAAQTTVYTTQFFAKVTSVTSDAQTDGAVAVGFWLVPGNISFKSSTDSGKTWSAENVLFDGLSTGDALYYAPSMVVTAKGEFLAICYRIDPITGEATLVSRLTTNQGTVWGDRFNPMINPGGPMFWGTPFFYGQGKVLSNDDIIFPIYTASSGALGIFRTSDNGQTFTALKFRDEFELVAKLQTLSGAGNFAINGYYASGGVATIPPPVAGYLVSINQQATTQDNSGVNFTIIGTADLIGTPISLTIPGPGPGALQVFTSANSVQAVTTSQVLGAAGSFAIDGTAAVLGVAVAAAAVKVSINDVLASDNSGVHFTINGENPVGTLLSETLVGPNAAQTLVYTKNIFARINSVTTDAATAGAVSIGFKGFGFFSITSVAVSGPTNGPVAVGWAVPNAEEPCLETLSDSQWLTVSRVSAVQKMMHYTTSDSGATWTGPLQLAAASGMTSYGYVSPVLTKYVFDGARYFRLDVMSREANSGLFTPEPSLVAWYGVAVQVFADPTKWGIMQVVVDGSNGGPPNIPNTLRGRSGYPSVTVNPVTNQTIVLYGVEYNVPANPRQAEILTQLSAPSGYMPLRLGNPTVQALAVGTTTPVGFGIFSAGIVGKVQGSIVPYNLVVKSTAPASFVATEVSAYKSSGGTLGLGSTIANSYGFFADSTNINGTASVGFVSSIDANLGTTTISTISSVAIAANLVTAVTTGNHLLVTGEYVTIAASPVSAGSFVTGAAYYITVLGTTNFVAVGAYSNTVGDLFYATGPGSGTGTATPAINGSGLQVTVVDAVTFTYPMVRPNMATSAVGGTVQPNTRYAFYGQGSAPSLFNGSIFQTSTSAATNMRLSRSITGAAQGFGIHNSPQVQADVTTAYQNYYSAPGVIAGATIGSLYHYRAEQGTISGAITVQYGFFASSSLATGGINYGYYGNLPAATTSWNFYGNGTAQNAFRGNTRIGAVTAPLNTLDITGSLGRGNPIVKTADFAPAATENWLINNKASATCTVTLPSAASFPGREMTILNYQAFTVVSASANVVPPTGGAAGTAILAATAGAKATLVSDGANWRAF